MMFIIRFDTYILEHNLSLVNRYIDRPFTEETQDVGKGVQMSEQIPGIIYGKVSAIASKRELPMYKVEQMASIPNGTIGKWRTSRGADINTIVKVANALNVTVDYLISNSEE